MLLDKTYEPSKGQINQVVDAQEKPKYEAHLRRVGRGRQTNHVSATYRNNHSRLFGETDIFRNLAKERN